MPKSSTFITSTSVSRKNSVISNAHISNLSTSNNCYGCTMASIDMCLTLLRVLLCASTSSSSSNHNISIPLTKYVRTELCNQGVLESLIEFSLKRKNCILSKNSLIASAAVSSNNAPANVTSTATSTQPSVNSSQPSIAISTTNQQFIQQQQQLYDRDVINLIYLLIRDNPIGSEMFHQLFVEKLESFLSHVYLSSNVSINGLSTFPLKHEMVLLSSLIVRQEDSCWEMRLRLLIHILLRSLNVATLSKSGLEKPSTNRNGRIS